MATVVVVGAGVGGLAAATRLAVAGHDVTVCEQASDVGGKLGWYTRDGFSFDTGPSLLTMPHVFGELFAAAGATLHDAVELRRLDPIARYLFADQTTMDAYADDTAFAAELDSRLGGGAGSAWQRFDAHAARVWAAAEQPFLRSPVSVAAFARLAARQPRDLATVAPGRTLRHVGRRYLPDPRLRMFLDRYATYAGSDPRRAPAALVVVPHIERRYGGWYVHGGLRRLAVALADLAGAHGARVRCATPVTAITRTAGGRVDGVLLADGGRLNADVVVANADAAQVYGSLVDHPASRARLRRLPPSMSGFVLLLALRGRSRRNGGLAHHTVTFPADYDAEFDAVFGGRLATDPAVYVSAPPDPELAPPGCEAWFVLVNAAPHAAPHAGQHAGQHAAPHAGQHAGQHANPQAIAHTIPQTTSDAGSHATPHDTPHGRDRQHAASPDPAAHATRATRISPAMHIGHGRFRARGVDWDRPGLADAYARHVLDLLAARGIDVRDRLLWYEARTPADLERGTGTVGGSIYGPSSNGPLAAFLRPANASPVPGLFLVGGSSHPGGGLPLVAMSAHLAADLIGPA